jgi:hypothetical protein
LIYSTEHYIITTGKNSVITNLAFFKIILLLGMLPLLFITPEERKADNDGSEKTIVHQGITADNISGGAVGGRTAASSRTADSRPAKGLS